MTPADFRARLEALFGPVATTQHAATALSIDPDRPPVNRRTVDRWCSGERDIPQPVLAWLEAEQRARHWADIVAELLSEATAPADER